MVRRCLRCPSSRQLIIGAAVLTILVAGITAGVMWVLRREPVRRAVTARLTLPLGDGQQWNAGSPHQIAISPDGSQIVYAANGRLYLRPLASAEARPIPGTDEELGQGEPTFSPDGLSVAFHAFSDNTIKRIALSGGTAVTVASAGASGFVSGMSWGADGLVIGLDYVENRVGDPAILRVPPSGGPPEVLMRVREGEIVRHPQVVSNGRVLLFTRLKGSNAFVAQQGTHWERDAQVVAQSIPTGEQHVLLTGGADAHYLPTGHLVYAVGGALYAVRLDLSRFATVGSASPVIEGVRRGTVRKTTAHFSVSNTGSLIYLPGPLVRAEVMFVLVQVDRSGQIVPLWLPPGLQAYPRYSPDGSKVAVNFSPSGQPFQIGIHDLSSGTELRQLTFDGENAFPIWTPDGVRVTYQSSRDGDRGLFWQRADGTGAAERLTTAKKGVQHLADSWSPDGKTLLFEMGGDESFPTFAPITKGKFSLWMFSPRDRRIERFATLESHTTIDAAFSPDGQWVAYGLDDDKGPKVYVEPFPRTGARYLVTNESGSSPVWSPDGKELLYASGADRYHVVPFSTRPTVSFGTVGQVPRGRLFGDRPDRRGYDLSPDGKRIVGTIIAPNKEQAVAPTIEVVLNWQEELKRLVPTR
jgi:Tol biopolymer transport system component